MVGQLSAPARIGVQARRQSSVVLLLTAISGFVDAVGLVSLGGAFTSVMTGNMVLTGIGVARGEQTLAATSIGAVLCYLVGCMVGARVAGLPLTGQPDWPPSVRRALMMEFALFAVSGLGWWVLQPWHSHGARVPLLFCNAVALGMQSAAVNRLGVSGLSTTYLTGTLTGIAVSFATGRPLAVVRRPIGQLCLLVAGGALGALLALHARTFVPVFPLAGLLLALSARAAPERELSKT